MKLPMCLVTLVAAGLWAQAPGSSPTPKAQRPAGPPAAAPKAQRPAGPPAASQAPVGPETVVATLDGKPVTAAEIQALFRNAEPQVLQNAMKDPHGFLRQYAMMRRLSEQAEQSKLDQQSPYKEALASSRMQILSQAQVQEKYQQIAVPPEEQKKFYESNKDRYAQVKVKVIYIPFSSDPAAQKDPKTKKLTEPEAKAKADNVVKQARAGADFVKLVKENSEDPTSAAKDGDFPLISKSDNIPAGIKNVVFALKKGEVSEPVRVTNGYYLFRAEDVTTKSYEEVKEEISNEMKLARLREFLESAQKTIQIKIDNESFFTQGQGIRIQPAK